MNPRTQLDEIIAAHLDPTSTEQFEAAEAMVQAAYNLSLDRIAKLETQIAELKDTNSHLLKDHRQWYAEELDEHKTEIVEPLHERIGELEEETDNARNLAIFMAGAWSGADSWIWEHAAHLEAVDKYPMMQGTANINRLKRIGKQPCDRVKAGKAIKRLLEDKEES